MDSITSSGVIPTVRPRLLVLSRNYPNPGLPARGLWAQRLTRAAAPIADVTVVAPLPRVPLTLAFRSMLRQRGIPREREEFGITVHHPRTLASMAHRLYDWDVRLEYPTMTRLVDRLHEARPFSMVHAHFIYPDGVLAARLGRRYGIPVIVSEHAFWHTWVRSHPAVWRQVQRALPSIHAIAGVSEVVRTDIEQFVGDRARTLVLPNVVDEDTFRAPAAGESWDPQLLLFVGMVRHVKGLDVLLHALARLLRTRPGLRLQVLGAEGFARAHRRDEDTARTLIADLGLAHHVEWTGMASPAEVAAAMRRAAVVVVPSRRETFCSVAVEALASGTPVVSTRSGGPDEYLTPALGRLVPVEDPDALAEAILDVLDRRPGIDRHALREAVLAQFGSSRATERLRQLYAAALAAGRG